MFRHILIASDGSKLSEKAVKYGLNLAKTLGAKVTGLHVIPKFHSFTYRAQMQLSYHTALTDDSAAGYKAATHECARKFLQTIKQAAATGGVTCDTVETYEDQPFKAIIEVAGKKDCDLILMASHGHSGVAGVLLGSETQKVLTHSHIPVLVYR